jgi:ankyrin repeat protein
VICSFISKLTFEKTKQEKIMKKLILLASISFGIIGCTQHQYQVGMQQDNEANPMVGSQDESSDDEAYASPLDQFLDLLENNTDKQIIVFLEKTLVKDPDALSKLYPSSDGDKENFIHCAAAKASLKVIQTLLLLTKDKAAMANMESDYKVTPLHLAALRGDHTIVQYFIGQGADPNAKDDEGNTVLHYASKKQANVKVVKLLLEKGARIEETIDPEDGSNLLHWAVQNDNLSLVEHLLEYYSAHCPELINKKTTRNPALTAEGLAKYLQRGNIITAFEKFEKSNL